MLGFGRKKREDPWRSAGLFRGLSAAELERFRGAMTRRELQIGDVLAEEGRPLSKLIWIEEGTVALTKRESRRHIEHSIGVLDAGDYLGDLALIDGLPRASTARAATAAVVWELPFSSIRGGKEGSGLSSALSSNLAKHFAGQMRASYEHSVENAQRRAAMGQFLVNVLILLVVYLVVISGLPHVSTWLPSGSSFISIPLQILFGLGSWLFIRGTGYELSRFGIGFKHFIGSLFEATLLTVPILGLITGVKWIVLEVHEKWRDLPLFEHPDWQARLSEPTVIKLLIIYAVSSAVQELIVRGALQSSLEMFLTGPNRVRSAILVSGLLFAALHIHIGFVLALVAFIPGVFWGILYARKRNLIGVTLSHIAVGTYAFFILGTWLP